MPLFGVYMNILSFGQVWSRINVFNHYSDIVARSHSNFHGLVTPSYLKYEERRKTTRFYMQNLQRQNLVTAA